MVKYIHLVADQQTFLEMGIICYNFSALFYSLVELYSDSKNNALSNEIYCWSSIGLQLGFDCSTPIPDVFLRFIKHCLNFMKFA